MSGIKELSVDQMAVLGLVLRQERPYAELAGMLDMDEAEMRRRAQEALDALGPDDGAGLPAERRAEIGDYLLGQRGDDERTETHRFLEESAPGRAWARTVADQLTELKHPLPEIPDGPADEAAEPAAPPPAPGRGGPPARGPGGPGRGGRGGGGPPPPPRGGGGGGPPRPRRGRPCRPRPPGPLRRPRRSTAMATPARPPRSAPPPRPA